MLINKAQDDNESVLWAPNIITLSGILNDHILCKPSEHCIAITNISIVNHLSTQIIFAVLHMLLSQRATYGTEQNNQVQRHQKIVEHA